MAVAFSQVNGVCLREIIRVERSENRVKGPRAVGDVRRRQLARTISVEIVLSSHGILALSGTQRHLARSTRHVASFCMVSAIKLCPVRFRARGCSVGKDMSVIGLLRTRNATAITAEDPTSVAPSIAEKYRSPRSFTTRLSCALAL